MFRQKGLFCVLWLQTLLNYSDELELERCCPVNVVPLIAKNRAKKCINIPSGIYINLIIAKNRAIKVHKYSQWYLYQPDKHRVSEKYAQHLHSCTDRGGICIPGNLVYRLILRCFE